MLQLKNALVNDGDIKVMANKFHCQYLGKDKGLCLCMSSLRPLHRQAAQQFDESFIGKQSVSFLSQPEQTIWVSRHRILRTQYLHLGAFI